MRTRRLNAAVVLASVALIWGLGILVGGILLRAASPDESLVSTHALLAFAILAQPALAAAAVWYALHRRCAFGDDGATGFAWSVIFFCVVVSVLGVAEGGLYLFPMALLMAAAAKRTPRGISSPA